jgi:hypothetical protein
MMFNEICQDLERELYKACVRYLSLLQNDVKNEKVYAFAILIESGFVSMGISVNTIEGLKERRIKEKSVTPVELITPDIYLEMSSAEWKYQNKHWDVFVSVNKVLDTFFEKLYEGNGFVDIDKKLNVDEIMNFAESRFIQIILNVLKRIKSDNLLNGSTLLNDLFLGVQFNDIGKEEIVLIEKVSKELNSMYWLDKVLQMKNLIK